MANYYVLLEVTVLYSFFLFYRQGYCLLPVKVSPVVVDGTTSNICPAQNNIDGEVSVTKEEIRQAITNKINPFLDRENTSPESCANSPGWTRVAFLNMSDPNEVCPSSLSLRIPPGRGCGRQSHNTTVCDSVVFNLGGQRYSKVCGQILAYQKGLTYAFFNYLYGGQTTIESAYVDGISLTHGPAGSRQHIWTFAAAGYEQNPFPRNVRRTCPCTNTQYNWTYQLPSFMGNNYFCDTGNHGFLLSHTNYFSTDPLWDGEGCGPFNTCCQFNNPPWFYTTLPQTTSDNIELHLCGTHSSDTVIDLVELYVK